MQQRVGAVIDVRPILMIVGILLTTLAVAMFLPALADASDGNPDWQVFLASAFLTLFIGVSLALTNRVGSVSLSVRQTFLLTTLSWTVLTAFAALPFAFARLDLTYTDAFFEAMSGLTTTGATVIAGRLDEAPPGILLWRALLQWLGGIGIIVMAIAVLPMLRIAGMQLFRTESSEIAEKVLPRTAQVAAVIGVIYVSLTAVAAAAYGAAGMRPFEAAAHAMTTIATAGFSTSDRSIGHFANATIEWLAVFFMLVASLPFLLYFQAVGGHPRALWRDSQVRWFLSVVVTAVAVMTVWRWLAGGTEFGFALRQTA
ncbi:MAG: TrkH family potassium uptake protein, partial [Alphaproteobacteria bacterium]